MEKQHLLKPSAIANDPFTTPRTRGLKSMMRSALVLFGLSAATALASDDTIFLSGMDPGLTIEGRVYWPGGIAGATVTARFSDQIASTTSRPDGSYGMVIEYSRVTGAPLVELRARGSGAQAHIEYAGQLGPFDRLLAAAGADETLNRHEEAFVDLTPYSTIVTAHLRAESGHADVTSSAAFDHAARSQQLTYVSSLGYAIALAATAELGLPAAATTTREAVDSLSNAQRLYADYRTLQGSADCTAEPAPAVCTIGNAFLGDAAVFPARAQTNPGAVHLASNGGGYGLSGGFRSAFSINGSSGIYQSTMNTVVSPITVTTNADGTFTLIRTDGQPLDASSFFTIVGGQQVLTRDEATHTVVRFVHTAANLAAFSRKDSRRRVYPDNPEIPPQPLPESWGWPETSLNNPVAAAQSGTLAPLANGRWLLTTAWFDASGTALNSSLAADIHAFGTTNGNTERSARPFALTSQNGDSFALDYGDRQVVTKLVNQDVPGIWRTHLTITSSTGTAYATGLLMKVDDPQPAWIPAMVPGLYRSRVNGFACDGPWGDLELLADGTCFSVSNGGWFGFRLDPGGTGVQAPNASNPAPITWNLLGGADQGRLRIVRTSGAITQSRGWEILKIVGNRYWMIENFESNSTGALASFIPTGRIYAFDRQP